MVDYAPLNGGFVAYIALRNLRADYVTAKPHLDRGVVRVCFCTKCNIYLLAAPNVIITAGASGYCSRVHVCGQLL